MTAVDLIALLLLILFALWGALKGSLRQLASLAVLFLAFPVATRFGPRIEGSVVKAVSTGGADLRLLAWGLVFAGALIAGGVIVALLAPLLARRGAGERVLGGLLGLLHGAAILMVLLYGVLLASRAVPASPAATAIRESHAFVGARGLRRVVGRFLTQPTWMPPRLDAEEGRAFGPSKAPGG